MKEKNVEKYLCQEVKKLGGIAYKFTSPGRRSVPDRLCVLPEGVVMFVECKAPGKALTDAQFREKERLQELEQWYWMVDTKYQVDCVLGRMRIVIERIRR